MAVLSTVDQSLLHLTGGQARFEVEATTVRAALRQIDTLHPGVLARVEAGMTTDANFTTSTFWSPGEPNNDNGGTEHYGGLNNYGFALNDYKNDQSNIGSLIEYGIDGTSLAIPLFAPPATLPDRTVSGSRNIAVRVGNTAPSVTSWSASISEDTTLAFATTDFTSRFADPELDSLASITLTAIPSATAGILRLDGATLAVNAVVTAGDLARLEFTPVGNYTGSATFSYIATDGNLTSGSAATVTITVVAINDPPVLDISGAPVVAAIAEDMTYAANTAVVSINLASYGSLGNPNGGGSAGSVTDVANFPVSGPSLRVYNAFTSGSASPNVWGLAGSPSSGSSELQFAVTGSLAGIRNFAAGDSISSSATFQWQFESTTFQYFGNVAANFGPGSYVGFRFTNDNGSTFNYGYLEVTWDSSAKTFQILLLLFFIEVVDVYFSFGFFFVK